MVKDTFKARDFTGLVSDYSQHQIKDLEAIEATYLIRVWSARRKG